MIKHKRKTRKPLILKGLRAMRQVTRTGIELNF